MTTANQAREAVFARFVDCWADATPYFLQNEEEDTDNLSEWARATVIHTDAGQETLGAPGTRRFERKAQLVVNIFAPGGKGTARSDDLIEIVQNAFEGFTDPGTSVSFNDVKPEEIGPDRTWFQCNVIADFRYDETK